MYLSNETFIIMKKWLRHGNTGVIVFSSEITGML